MAGALPTTHRMSAHGVHVPNHTRAHTEDTDPVEKGRGGYQTSMII